MHWRFSKTCQLGNTMIISVILNLAVLMDEFGMPYSHLTPWLTVGAGGQSAGGWGPRWSSPPPSPSSSSSSSQLPMPFLVWASSSSYFHFLVAVSKPAEKKYLGSTQLQPLDGPPGFFPYHLLHLKTEEKEHWRIMKMMIISYRQYIQ